MTYSWSLHSDCTTHFTHTTLKGSIFQSLNLLSQWTPYMYACHTWSSSDSFFCTHEYVCGSFLHNVGGKSWQGLFTPILISIPPTLHPVPHDFTHGVGSHDDFCGFQDIDSDCVDTKLRGIKATCIGSYTGKISAIANETTCSDFVCMCLWTHSKVTKSTPKSIRHSLQGIYKRDNIRKQGVIRRGRYLLEGGVFLRASVP